jgi:hypothetical protein
MDDRLWARIIVEFAAACRRNHVIRPQLLQSLPPLYLGRVASFVKETANLSSQQVEDRIEGLCLAFEELKPYLVKLWEGEDAVKDQPSLEVENV